MLYKLDGGIDHILVDEAQDTAPEQWDILRALTAEFFAGAGAAARPALARTLFVVGDEKQSIYSFQGAAPGAAGGRDRSATAAGRPAPAAASSDVPLLDLWRSTPQVLALRRRGVRAPRRWPARSGPRADAMPVTTWRRAATDAGCVDLWPLEREEPGEERDAWDAPLDAEPTESANKQLAAPHRRRDRRRWSSAATRCSTRTAGGLARPARYGDVLILVRRRGALFEEIIRALKRPGVPVAGADRLTLSEHIVFDDLLALARFARFPDDDLTLAALLRSPFCDLDEDGLYDLAHGREGDALARAAAARPASGRSGRGARAFLRRARAEAAARARRSTSTPGVLGRLDAARPLDARSAC